VIWRSGDLVIENPRRAAIVACGPAALAGAAVLAPYLFASGYTLFAAAIFWFFSPVCHQDPARSFWIFGAPIAICARCLGIYLGAAVGAWIPAPRRVLLSGLALFAALNLADVLTEAAAWHGNWKLTRFALGLLLGGAASGLVAETLTSGARASALLRPLRHG
jgi:uncharacterized membrane protein